MTTKKLNWQNDECYICFDSFVGPDPVPRVVLYNCLHSVCFNCLELYKKHNPEKQKTCNFYKTCQFCKTAKYSSNALVCKKMEVVKLKDNTKIWRFFDLIFEVKSRKSMVVDEMQKTLLKLTPAEPREKLIPYYSKFFNTAMNIKDKIYQSKITKYGQGKNTNKPGKLKVKKSSKLFTQKMIMKDIMYKNL